MPAAREKWQVRIRQVLPDTLRQTRCLSLLQPTIMTTQRPDNRATAIDATTVLNWTLLAVAAALITLGMLVGSGRLGFK